MRQSLQDFMKKIKGQTVFIIGGGASAKNVDFNLLQNETVVCINDAYRDFPNATAIYWVDETWAAENYDNLKVHNCQHRFTSKPSQHISYDVNNDPKTLGNSYILKRTGDIGYDSNPDCVMGNNSGVQVLNLVINMKPKTIVLIGYDMKITNKETHYHNQPRPFIGSHIYNDMFIPSIMGLYKGLSSSDSRVEIINANPDSGVRCFNFGCYTDFLST